MPRQGEIAFSEQNILGANLCLDIVGH